MGSPMDRTLALLGLAFAAILVGGYVLLTVNRLPTDGFVIFVSGPLVSTIVGAVVSRQVSKVQQTATEVKQATNGTLSVRLDSIDSQMADASAERQQIAADAPGLATDISVASPRETGQPGKR